MRVLWIVVFCLPEFVRGRPSTTDASEYRHAESDSWTSVMRSFDRRSLMQAPGAASACNLSSTPHSMADEPEPLWYTLVDNKAVYNGTVSNRTGVTLYCASSANVTSQASCNPATQRWDKSIKLPPCRDCQLKLNGSVTGSMRVYNLANGENRVLSAYDSDWTGCPDLHRTGIINSSPPPPPPPSRPIPVYNHSEDVSFAFTIMADSLEDRWITASTCGLEDVAYDDTTLRVREGCDAHADRIIENGDFCGIQSQLAFLAVAGQSYTVYLTTANRSCVVAPAITISAEKGSLPALSKQSYLISPSLDPGQCISAQGPRVNATLQPCDSTNLDQFIQIKDVGNGRVFLRHTHYDANTTLAAQQIPGSRTRRLVGYVEQGVSSPNPYKEPIWTVRSSADSDPPVWNPPTEEEQFIINALPSGSYQIRHPFFRTCLSSDLTLTPCVANAPAQSFNLTKPSGSTSAAQLAQVIRVQLAVAPSLCWQAGVMEGAPLVLVPCNSTNQYQTFLVRDAGNGFVQLVEQGSGKGRVIELPPGVLDDLTSLQVNHSVTGALNQLWSLMPLGSGSYRLMSALTSLCVESASFASVDAAQRQNVCTDAANLTQSFAFSVMSPTGPPYSPPEYRAGSPSQPPAPTSSISPPPVLDTPSQTQSQGDSKASVPPGAIAGIVVGVVVLMAVCCALVIWVIAKRRRTQQGTTLAKGLAPDAGVEDAPIKDTASVKDAASVKDVAHVDAAAVARQKLQVKGLVKGEPFLRGAAPHFTWSDLVPGPTCQAVEEGVNAEQMDKLAGAAIDSSSGMASGSPVVRLTSCELAQQIELLKEGLLGRGATALVFKCRWPSRFGPNALLACKVLRDPFEGENSEHVQAFKYEARVLEELRHPNIVRLYGYCLEAPTVCLIMELLPSSLKKRLGHGANTTPLPSMLLGTQGQNPTTARRSSMVPATSTFTNTSSLYETQGFPVSGDSSTKPGAIDITVMTEPGGPLARVDEGQWEMGPGSKNASPELAQSSTADPGAANRASQPVEPTSSTQGPAAFKTSLDGTQVVCRVEMPQQGLEGQAAPGTTETGHSVQAGSPNLPIVRTAAKPPLPQQNLQPASITLPTSGSMLLAPPHNMLSPAVSSTTVDPALYEIGSSVSVLVSTPTITSTTSGDNKSMPHYTAAVNQQGPWNAPSFSHVLAIDVGRAGSHVPHTPGTAHTSSSWELRGSPRVEDGLLPNPYAGHAAASFVTQSGFTHHSSSSVLLSSSTSRLPRAPQAARLTMLEVLRMSTDIACGLAYLHQRPAPGLETAPSFSSSVTQSVSGSTSDGHGMIVHRDIKPDNVLVNSLGVAKICDFGLARVHDSTTIYSVHVAVGTLRYMAPELLDGETNRPMTDRVDLYSLGMLMWEMVTGEPPWKGLTDPQIMTAVQLKKRPSMSTLAGGAAAQSQRATPFPRSSEDRAWMAPNTLGENEVFAEDLYPSRQTSVMTSSSLCLPSTPSPVGWQGSGPLPRADIEHSSAPARHAATASVPNLGPPVSVSGVATNSAGERVWSSTRARPKSTVSSPNLGANLLAATQSQPAGCLAADTAASFDAIPQFKTLISACWQHNSIRRPTAQAVHKQLATLLRQQQEQAAAAQAGSVTAAGK